MEMKRKMRRLIALVMVSLILIVLFSTDGTKEPEKEYILTDYEILGQEVEWELIESHIAKGRIYHVRVRSLWEKLPI